MKDLEQLLSKYKYNCTLLGLHKEDNWEHYKFNCNIEGECFTFRVGIGHVKRFRGDNANKKAREEGYEIILENDYHLGVLRLKRIKISEIVYCTLMDYTEENFQDWCDNFGYDTDSRKALATYLECQENYVRLRKALGQGFNEVRELAINVDDY